MTWAARLFEGKQVLVAGGTSGIGAATATRFAELGADVLAVGLRSRDVDEGPSEAVRVQEADITDGGVVESLIASFQTLDVLVVCAGISRDRDEYDLDTFERVLDVNLVAGMRLCALTRPLLRTTTGSIALTSSMYSVFGAADRPAYGASKGAVNQLTKSLAVEFAIDGIRVNAVAPGWIETPLSEGLRADAAANGAVLARVPVGRWGVPAEVADAFVFLSSPAARYVTGAVLPVDGGYLCV
jgi:NAD(P)-dependent dehydrogenase (short-subunit alcohol dehydrogenase family)